MLPALILAAYVGFIAALAPAVWYGDNRWLILYLAACAAVLVVGAVQTAWRWWRRPTCYGEGCDGVCGRRHG